MGLRHLISSHRLNPSNLLGLCEKGCLRPKLDLIFNRISQRWIPRQMLMRMHSNLWLIRISIQNMLLFNAGNSKQGVTFPFSSQIQSTTRRYHRRIICNLLEHIEIFVMNHYKNRNFEIGGIRLIEKQFPYT
jgi:hypothetical protein